MEHIAKYAIAALDAGLPPYQLIVVYQHAACTTCNRIAYDATGLRRFPPATFVTMAETEATPALSASALRVP
jgi:hypothetical protein